MIGKLTQEQRSSWDRHGYVVVEGFASAATCEAMLARAVDLARRQAAGEALGRSFVDREKNPGADARLPEDLVSKIFILHNWEPVFEAFARDERLLDLLEALLGPDIDCFLSQFIFKNPGARGQPWHQDSLYFPFEPDRQVGVWLAVTEATLENGCLSVLPGSHTEPVHAHVPDRRPGANLGYTEIVDHDMSGAVPVTMAAGDLLVFDSHLMHCSTDNVSRRLRAAMVYHYSPAGTVDRTFDRLRQRADALGELPDRVVEKARSGDTASAYHWMPVRRRR